MAKENQVDSKKIEKVAVSAVRYLVEQCDKIDPKLNEDDKNMLVDGTFDVYSAPSLNRNTLIDSIDVQIKGTVSKLRINKRGFAKYDIDVVNLRRYLDVYQGVLFFCVYLVRQSYGGLTPKCVYYSELLPYDITQILSGIKTDQQTVAVRFKPFPTEPKEILRLVSSFSSDKKKQLKSVVSGYGFLDKTQELPANIRSFSFSMQLFPGEDITSLPALSAGAYMYGEDDSGRTLVFGKLENVEMLARGEVVSVGSGDFELETMVFIGNHERGRYIEFEGVSLIATDNEVTFNYSISGGIRKRYNTVRFMSEFISTGELRLNGKVVLRASQRIEDEECIIKLNDALPIYEMLVEVIDGLHVSVDWDPSNMSVKELNDLEFMHRLLIEKEPLTNSTLSSPIIHFDIQGARIYALAVDKEDGSYSFTDLQTDSLFFVFGWPNETAQNKAIGFDPVPPILVVGKEGYKHLINLDQSTFSRMLEKCPVTQGNHLALNERLLELLEAYDEGCLQPEAVIACAEVLGRMLYEYDSDAEVYALNWLQAVKRQRDFTANEHAQLRAIAIKGTQMYCRAAAYALLDSSEMAMDCLGYCSEAERKLIYDYPISRFFIARHNDTNVMSSMDGDISIHRI